VTTILVIDDEFTWADFYRNLVKPGVIVLHAWSLDQGKEYFERYRCTITMVIIDGRVRAPIEDSIRLVRYIREVMYFMGPIVAASGDPTNNAKLVAAGCERAWSSKIPDREEAHQHYPGVFAQVATRR
jgi:hypothetical protein